MKYGAELICIALFAFVALLGAGFAADDAFRQHMWVLFFTLAGRGIVLARSISAAPAVPAATVPAAPAAVATVAPAPAATAAVAPAAATAATALPPALPAR